MKEDSIMNREEIFLKNSSLLMKRFPSIGLLSSCFQTDFIFYKNSKKQIDAKRKKSGKWESIYGYEDIEKTMTLWEESLFLNDIDILYVYGLGLGHSYYALKKWLNKKETKKVIFIEDDPKRFGAFLRTKQATTILEDEKVHLSFTFEKHQEENFIPKLQDFSSFFVTPSLQYQNKKKFSDIRLEIFRTLTIFEYEAAEHLNAEKLIHLFIKNTKKFFSSYSPYSLKSCFKNIPAVICGAGPSLSKNMDVLKRLENKALIFAGGSAITGLSYNNVFPNMGVVIDPNNEEYLRLKNSAAYEIPTFYSHRVLSDIFGLFNGPLLSLYNENSTKKDMWLQKEIDQESERIFDKLSKKAGSVTCSSIAIARFLGCNPIVLCGVDLSFTKDKYYVDGVGDNKEVLFDVLNNPQAKDTLFKKLDKDNNEIYTNAPWILESEVISSYSKEFPDITFLNASGGVGFKDIPDISLCDFEEKYCSLQYDLRSWVFSEIQMNKFSKKSLKNYEKAFSLLEKSFLQVNKILQILLTELASCEDENISTGKMIVYQMDLEEEIAYRYFLLDVCSGFERFWDFQKEKISEKKKLLEKYAYLQKITQSLLSTLQK